MQIENWKDDESITIAASSMHLFGASWKMFGVNLIIQDSSLNNFKLLFSGNRVHPNNELNYQSNLTLLNISFIYSNYTGQEPLIYLEIANVVFFTTTMQNIRAPHAVIINATLNSTAKFIVNNTLSLASLSNFSSIFLEDCLVKNNTSRDYLLSAHNFSSILIEHCVAANNMFGYTLFENTHYGRIVVNRSTFTKNKIEYSYGICFAVYNNTKISISDTNFHENQFQILLAEFNISVNFYSCQFIQNVIDYCCMANIYYCGSAISGSCISVENANVQVKTSTFYTQSSGVAVFSTGSNLLLENCIFLHNSSPADSLIEIDNSTLNITHCKI